MEYQFYIVQLRCGHLFPVGDFENKPNTKEMRYCSICQESREVLAVYKNSREIDDIEEMME